MKKGALTFEEPLQPNRLIHALLQARLTKTEVLYATAFKEVSFGHKKNCVLQFKSLVFRFLICLFFLLCTSFIGLVALHADAFFVHRGEDFGEEFAAESQFAPPSCPA